MFVRSTITIDIRAYGSTVGQLKPSFTAFDCGVPAVVALGPRDCQASQHLWVRGAYYCLSHFDTEIAIILTTPGDTGGMESSHSVAKTIALPVPAGSDAQLVSVSLQPQVAFEFVAQLVGSPEQAVCHLER